MICFTDLKLLMFTHNNLKKKSELLNKCCFLKHVSELSTLLMLTKFCRHVYYGKLEQAELSSLLEFSFSIINVGSFIITLNGYKIEIVFPYLY